MTVAAEIPLALYDGDGVTTAFPAPWRYLDTAHLLVELIDAAGVATALALNVDYTATEGATDAGGTVTAAVPPAVGMQLRVRRATPLAQVTAYPTSGAFPAASHERALDRLTLIGQEHAGDINDLQARALQVPLGQTAPELDIANVSNGEVLAMVGGKFTGIANDPAGASDSAAAALVSRVGAETARTFAETARSGAEDAEEGAQAILAQTTVVKDQALAAALASADIYPGARAYVPQGAVTGAATIGTAGSGGANGTFALAFTGGNFAVNPTGTFTVAGGAVTAITITGPGLYIGNAISKPTLSFAASAGLTGAAGSYNSAYLKTAGQYYLTDHASDPAQVALFQNQANAAVEVDASVDWLNIALAVAAAATATTKVVEAAGYAGQAAASAASVGGLTSDSLKAKSLNTQFAGQTSVIKQAKGSLTNILTADNSVLFERFYFDPERLHQNNNYALSGNAGPSLVGRWRLYYVPRAINTGAGANRQLFTFDMRRSAGTAYTFRGGTMPEVAGWYDAVVRRTTGGVFTLDVFSCADGTKVADGAASALTQTLGGINTLNETHFYIGDARDVSAEVTIASALGQNTNTMVGWDGGIAMMGIADVAGSDADWQAIALGADPLTRLGASNFKYFRRFRGADSVSLSAVAGTSDTTAAATVIGEYLPGGTPGRQGATDYITLDQVKDYWTYGLKPGALCERVLFSGTCGGVGYMGYLTAPMMLDYRQRRQVRYNQGFIEARFAKEDGGAWMPWTRITGTTATGVTNGRIFTENARSAVGLKVLLTGQSQDTIFMGGASLTNPAGSVVSLGYKLQAECASVATQMVATNASTQIAFQMVPVGGNILLSDGYVAFVQEIRKRMPCVVQMVVNALVGSSALDMIDDWSRTSTGTLDLQALINYAGNDVSVLLWQWFTTHQAEGANIGSTILDPVIKGYGTNASTHWLGDGILRNGFAVAISSPTRQGPTTAGPHDADAGANFAAVRKAMRDWAVANGFAFGPEITDMKLAAGEGPHQDTTSVRGSVRMGIRMAECTLRAMKYSDSQDPYLTTPVFNGGKTTITLSAVMPNPGSRLRVDDEATYAANVQGFEISTNGGTTWSRSGFTAAISTTPATRNKVVLTKSSTDWTGVAAGQMMVKAFHGSPFGYGTSLESTELFRGGLYDGTEIEGGLGLPFIPLAPTVVA